MKKTTILLGSCILCASVSLGIGAQYAQAITSLVNPFIKPFGGGYNRSTSADSRTKNRQEQVLEIIKRLQAEIKRVDAQIIQTEDRVLKLSSQGKNTTKEGGYLVQAKEAIASAKVKLEALKNAHAQMGDNSTPEDIRQIKEIAHQVSSDVSKAKRYLDMIVRPYRYFGQ